MAWKRLFLNWLSIAIGIVIAANTSSGITYGGDYSVLFVVVVLLSGLNMLLKPLLVLFTLPFIVLTLGLGLWILNAFLFSIIGAVVQDFHVASFGAALWGALWVSLANFVVGGSLPGQGRRRTRVHFERGGSAPPPGGLGRPPESPSGKSTLSDKKEDVIDI